MLFYSRRRGVAVVMSTTAALGVSLKQLRLLTERVVVLVVVAALFFGRVRAQRFAYRSDHHRCRWGLW